MPQHIDILEKLILERVYVRLPHARRVAEMRAIAARVVVPTVGPLCAISKMPPPPRACQLIKRQQANFGVPARVEHRTENTVAYIDVEILDWLASAERIRAGIAILPFTSAVATPVACLEMLGACLLEDDSLSRARRVLVKLSEGALELVLVYADA